MMLGRCIMHARRIEEKRAGIVELDTALEVLNFGQFPLKIDAHPL